MTSKSVDQGLFLLRLGAGLMLAGHGLGKAMDLIGGQHDFPDPLGIGALPSLILATFGELVCGLLVAFGWKTRLAAIPAAITMLVAAFGHHRHDPWDVKEFPLLYAVAFVTVALTGPGRFSLDAWLDRRRALHRRLAR